VFHQEFHGVLKGKRRRYGHDFEALLFKKVTDLHGWHLRVFEAGVRPWPGEPEVLDPAGPRSDHIYTIARKISIEKKFELRKE
jgi:hypothetical protein